MAEDLRKLPPEERLKRLKAQQKKREAEAVQAKKLIVQAQQELANDHEAQRLAGPAVVVAESQAGFSMDEKKLLHMVTGVAKPKTEDDVHPVKEQLQSLEETVGASHVQVPPDVVQAAYAQHLSQQPVQQLYQEVVTLAEQGQERGYLTAEEQRSLVYHAGAIERKRQGGYAFDERAHQAAHFIEDVAGEFLTVKMYKTDQRALYR